jgi:hypothetical protein
MGTEPSRRALSKDDGEDCVMKTAAEYRAEALRCQELASHYTGQKRKLSSVLMELAQEYNRAAREAEERDVSLQARARQKAAGELH